MGPTKTERFEMRLDEDILMRVDNWRAKESDVPSRSEAMRRLVERGLLSSTSDGSVALSDGEKLIFLALRDIAKHLKVKRDDVETDFDFVASAIYGGHLWGLRWKMSGLFHDYADSPQDVREVLDILDMWTAIETGYEQLSKKDKDKIAADTKPLGPRVTFPGFDGNNESEQLGIAAFLIGDLERFSRFKGRGLNAHMPTLATHRRMLAVFGPMRQHLDGTELGTDQILALLKARRYPGRV